MDSSSLVSAQFSCIPWSPKINAAFGFRREKPISSFPGFADEQFRFGILAVCCWVGGCWETLDTPSYDLYIPLYHDVVQQKMGNNIFHFPNVMISYTISTSHKNLPKVIHVVFRQKTVPALRMPSSPKTWFIESYVPPLLAMSCWWKRSCPPYLWRHSYHHGVDQVTLGGEAIWRSYSATCAYTKFFKLHWKHCDWHGLDNLLMLSSIVI